MALLINRPIAEGFPDHEFYVRVHCAAAVKTRLAPRPNPQVMADAAYAVKLAAGLTAEDIAARPAEHDGQPTRWTSDAERLNDAAAVAADRAKRAGEEAVRTAAERDVRSSARIEFYRSKADAEAGRMPFDVTFAAFDLDLSDGASNALAQAYEAARRRYPNARDDVAMTHPEPPQAEEHHFADLMLADETRDAELDALRARIAELEAAPVLELSNDPPAEALMEAYPDEDHAALKARILAEFASLRNALVGHIPMTMEQLARLQALEHPKFQTWLQA
jgi:hypothetical protein